MRAAASLTVSCPQPNLGQSVSRLFLSFAFTFISRASSRLLGDVTRRHDPLSLAPALSICFSPGFPLLLHLTPPRPILLPSTQHLLSRREGCLAELLFLDGTFLSHIQRKFTFSFIVSCLLSACCYSTIPFSIHILCKGGEQRSWQHDALCLHSHPLQRSITCRPRTHSLNSLFASHSICIIKNTGNLLVTNNARDDSSNNNHGPHAGTQPPTRYGLQPIPRYEGPDSAEDHLRALQSHHQYPRLAYAQELEGPPRS